jgi:hypothetical protein
MKQALLGCGFAAMLMTNAEATCKNKIISKDIGKTNTPVPFKASLPLFVAANQGLSEYVRFQIPEKDLFGIGQPTIKKVGTEVQLQFECGGSYQNGACSSQSLGDTCPEPQARGFKARKNDGPWVDFCAEYKGGSNGMQYSVVKGTTDKGSGQCVTDQGAY